MFTEQHSLLRSRRQPGLPWQNMHFDVTPCTRNGLAAKNLCVTIPSFDDIVHFSGIVSAQIREADAFNYAFLDCG
jgi:hypothetical protein